MLTMLELADAAGNQAIHDFVRKSCNWTLEHMDFFSWSYDSLYAIRGPNYRIFRSIMLDDAGAPTLPYVELLNRKELPAARGLVESMARYLMQGQMRLKDGTYCRMAPIPETVWADDLFMSVPLLLRLGEMTGEKQYYDESVRQVEMFNKWLFDEKTGLYHHGWYNTRRQNSTVFWGRANGWVVWATSETLLKLPQTHPGYKRVLKLYRQHLAGVARYQNRQGMWHQVLDHPESFEETSCTAMFVLGMARGVSQGWLDASYREPALKGWKGVLQHIDSDGTVHGICQGTGIGEDLAFYFNRKTPDHDPRGLGAVILAGVEVAKLQQ